MTIFNRQGISSRKRRSAAFTLAEMMVTVTLLAVVLGSIIPTFMFFSKSIAALGNYSVMSAESRGALELFGRDLHVAEDLEQATDSLLTVRLPLELNDATITYKYNADQKNLVRIKDDPIANTTSEEILFEDVDVFSFVYYNRLSVDVSESPSILAETKSVQINAKLLKKVISADTTDYIISARFLMRNFN